MESWLVPLIFPWIQYSDLKQAVSLHYNYSFLQCYFFILQSNCNWSGLKKKSREKSLVVLYRLHLIFKTGQVFTVQKYVAPNFQNFINVCVVGFFFFFFDNFHVLNVFFIYFFLIIIINLFASKSV